MGCRSCEGIKEAQAQLLHWILGTGQVRGYVFLKCKWLPVVCLGSIRGSRGSFFAVQVL